MAGWSVHEDGSFTLSVGGIRLTGAYPAIDGRPVHPLRVDVAGGERPRLTYRLPDKVEVVLELARDDQGLVLRTRVRGLSQAPLRLDPFAGATVVGAGQLYLQGLQSHAASGFIDLPTSAAATAQAWDSYGLCGLVDREDHAVVMFACDHRRYLSAAMVRSTPRLGGVDRTGEPTIELAFGFATERAAWNPDGEELPEVRVLGGTPCWSTFRSAASLIASASGARTPARPIYVYSSPFRRDGRPEQAELEGLLQWLTTADPRVPLQAIQIEGVGAGGIGDAPGGPEAWPGGIEAAFAAIRAAGFRPGLTLAPLVVAAHSRVHREHPEWLLRDVDGQLIQVDEATAESEGIDRYLLDTSHPEALAHLQQVCATIRGWGCRYLSTDFGGVALQESPRVRRHQPGRTGVEYLRETLGAIRSAIGEDCTWLGIGMPFLPAIGAVDAMRIVAPATTDAARTAAVINAGAAGAFVNNLWWQNDLGAIPLRDRPPHQAAAESAALAYFQGVLGVAIATGDALQRLPSDRLNLWYFLEPDERPWHAVLPRWNRQRHLRFAAREFRGLDAWAVVAFNPTDQPVTEVLRLEALGITSANAFAWEPGRARRLGSTASLCAEVPAHQAQLFFISQWGEPPPPDLSLGGKLLSYWLIGSA